MTANILPNDNNDRIDRLEALMERLINVNLATQSQIGFLAGTDRKIDIILRHITGMNGDSPG
jgi:predicted DNA-binding helix-hairpin-helix protein